jgi:hypothetical protein
MLLDMETMFCSSIFGKAGETIPNISRLGAQLMSGDVKEVR